MIARRTVLALVLVTALGGCGGASSNEGSAAPASSNEGSAAPAPAPSPSTFDEGAFRRKAELICANFYTLQTADAPSEPDAVALFLQDLAEAHKDVYRQLAALEYPPTEEGAAVRRVLVDGVGKLQNDFVTAVAEAGQASQRRDRAAFDAAIMKITTLQPPDQASVLRRYRLPECAQTFSTT